MCERQRQDACDELGEVCNRSTEDEVDKSAQFKTCKACNDVVDEPAVDG